MKCKTCRKLKKYLEKKEKQYTKKGFSDYSDVEYFAENEPIYRYANKEVKRCQFLLDMMVDIEKILN